MKKHVKDSLLLLTLLMILILSISATFAQDLDDSTADLAVYNDDDSISIENQDIGYEEVSSANDNAGTDAVTSVDDDAYSEDFGENGDYPEEMTVVFAKLKQNGTYPYRKILVLLVAALLPLIFGSSVGPEAGMVGIVVALCCWAGENLRFAGSQSAYYSRVGASVSLSVLFRSPLFGILDEMEQAGEDRGLQRGDGRGLRRLLADEHAAGKGFGGLPHLRHHHPGRRRLRPLHTVSDLRHRAGAVLRGLGKAV